MLELLELAEIAFADHHTVDPLTDAQLVEVGAVARVGPRTRVLDLACGRGEMLCRWAAEFGSSGVGVEISGAFAAAARERAAQLGVTDRVVIEEGDASTYAPTAPYDVAACLGATWIGGDLEGTIDLLRRAAPGGVVLVGEPYWREEPPAGAAAALGLADHPVSDLPGLLDRFDAAGADLSEMVLADEHGWDRYAAAQWWAMRRWLDDHPGDPAAGQVREFRDQVRRAHLTYQRRYLGWGVFVLR